MKAFPWSPPDVHRIELDRCQAQPWKNGGGVTRELLAWPPHDEANASDHNWSLRVSVADITQNGPFSSFPGIDRCFAVLEGEGVELDLPGNAHRQRAGDPPLAFAGEHPIGCRLLQGATRDLNLMGRRAHGRISLQVARPGSIFDTAALWRGLFVFEAAEVQFDDSSPPHRLRPGTLCWSEAAGRAVPGATVHTPHPGAMHSDSSSHIAAIPPWRLIGGDRAFWLALLPLETPS